MSITTPSSPSHAEKLPYLLGIVLAFLLLAAITVGEDEPTKTGIHSGIALLQAESPAPTSTSTPLNPLLEGRASAANNPVGYFSFPSATPSPFPTQADTPTPTLAPTSLPTPEPPPIFTSLTLRKEIKPVEYLEQPCEAVRMRWSPEGSPPHTVVVPVMFHSILKNGRSVTMNQDITERQFKEFVSHAKSLGFETITTLQLEEFLYRNAWIPPRSMLLMVDDRRPGVVQNNFLPVLQENSWTVTLAWISADNGPGLWAQMEALHEKGYLDVQSHGYRHIYLKPGISPADMQEEITRPVEVLEEHFGERPTAYIWPGGHYSPEAVQMARQAGYRLGFTIHSPMPVRFNWIPLVAQSAEIGDPLMVLPRAWSYEAKYKLDQAVEVAEQARIFALDNYPAEAGWYREACSGELPPLEHIYPETGESAGP